MKQIDKHRFDTLSMLTVDKGQLDVTFIPVHDRPYWVLPSAMITHVEPYMDADTPLTWQGEAVYSHSLVVSSQLPDKAVILESTTIDKRIALLVKGNLEHQQIKISDTKDVEYSERNNMTAGVITQHSGQAHTNQSDDINLAAISEYPTFIFQMIEINGKVYTIPDLDVLNEHLKTSYKNRV